MRVVMQVVLRALMLFSLATLAFIYGFLCHEYRLFPFHHLRNAHIASKAIVEVAQMPSPRMPDAHLVKINQPTVIGHATTASSPYVLVSAGGGMKLPGIDHEVMTWIIDRSGRVVHSWKAQPDLWRDLKMVRAGDLLISLRNLNTLAVVDRHTKLIKWCSSGTTIGQHSPRRYRQGILAFDNLGGDAQLGGTRLVHIDYLTGQPQTLFPRPGVEMPDVCRTTYSGHIDLHRDDRHALMCITNSGALWEVDLDSGKVVWEYLVNDPRQPQLRAGLGYACYVDELFARDAAGL